MPRRYNPRFAPVRTARTPLAVTSCDPVRFLSVENFRPHEQSRSRSGCHNCRKRRVKCDETFPVCTRCLKRGEVCKSVSRSEQWDVLVPSLAAPVLSNELPSARSRLLKYWCERASHIMVLDPDVNPFSFPLLNYIGSSPSLIHAIASVSAAHERFFEQSELQLCLEERSIALSLLQNEIYNQAQQPQAGTFLSIFILGISTPWIDGIDCHFGIEHLKGASAIISIIIAAPDFAKSQLAKIALGTYLYWYMACSFLMEADDDQPPIEGGELYKAMKQTTDTYNPIIGYCVDLMYTIGKLGRYCRSVVDWGVRDLGREQEFEAELLASEPNRETRELGLIGDSFKHHGLINLYRIAGRPGDTFGSYTTETEDIIHGYALQTVRDLDQIPTNSWYTNMQAISLLTAGSELWKDDCKERAMVVERFNALYSINRIPGNLTAVEILRDVWIERDAGRTVSWLDTMLSKGWKLSLG